MQRQRTAVIWSPKLGQIIINSNGPVRQVETWLSDYRANQPGSYEDCVIVRVPRRFRYDRFTNGLR